MSTGRRLFGLETEYAVTAISKDRQVVPTGDVCGGLLRAGERCLASLPGGHDPGLFLSNGSRLYIDAGAHPELAGPECLDPSDAVRYLRAGDLIMRRLADDVLRHNPWVATCDVFAGNVDYGGTGASWGAHESYCHRCQPADLHRALIPHLVTRVVYTGAGGFVPTGPGIEFTLSPRAAHLVEPVSEGTVSERGIVNTRVQSLSREGWRRQHLICGESLRSDMAAWLRVGTTALVVALADGGMACGDQVLLYDPIGSLRAVASDPTCTRRLRLTNGGTATALEIQRHYLACATANLTQPYMPAWAHAVCQQWERVLDRLALGPDSVATTLDWAIKWRIYRSYAERRGIAWDGLAEASERRQPNAVLGALRRDLFELDTRWAKLADGLFAQLDASGHLDHRVAGVDRVEQALDLPPAEGRAHVRGEVIRRLQHARRNHWCSWTEIVEAASGRRLDLSDPFTASEIWRIPASRSEAPAVASRTAPEANDRSLPDEIRRLLAQLRGRRRARTTAPVERP